MVISTGDNVINTTNESVVLVVKENNTLNKH